MSLRLALGPLMQQGEAGPDYLDDFNRADSSVGAISGDWTDIDSKWQIASNQAKMPNAGGVAGRLLWDFAMSSTDHYAEMDHVSGVAGPPVRSDNGLFVRGNSTMTDGYFGRVGLDTGVYTAHIYRVTSGSFTLIASASSTAGQTASRWRLQAVGSTIKFFTNDGVERLSVTDATHSGTRVGIYGFVGGTEDNWEAGAV